MHSCRLNFLFVLPEVLLLVSTCSSFLGTTRIGLAQLLMLLDIMPASSNCLISWSRNSQYFKGMVKGMEGIGEPSVGMSNSIRLVLPISIVLWDMILTYFWSSSSCSCAFASSGISAFGIDLRGDLVLGSSCRLVPSSISGNNFALLHCTWFQLTFWISSHFSASASVAKGEILDILQKLLFVLSMGIFKFCGVLWLTLWRTSSSRTHSGNRKVLKLSS